jgi:hypothetical protein
MQGSPRLGRALLPVALAGVMMILPLGDAEEIQRRCQRLWRWSPRGRA